MRSAQYARPAAWMWLGLACALALAGCAASPPRPAPTSSGASDRAASETAAPAVPSSCPSTARWNETTGFLDRQGVGEGATLWALFFPTEPVLRVGQEIKVVWRMTGDGDLSISATGPDGTVIEPAWGPEKHSGSNWHRPGEEWGTGWVFPAAGCWTINARRTTGSGYLVLRVAG